jgi:hypothetical protein
VADFITALVLIISSLFQPSQFVFQFLVHAFDLFCNVGGELAEVHIVEVVEIFALILFVEVYIPGEYGGLAVDAISKIFFYFLYFFADCGSVVQMLFEGTGVGVGLRWGAMKTVGVSVSSGVGLRLWF